MRTAYPAGRELPVKVLDLAEFDLHLDLVPVNGLREQLDIDALLMGDSKLQKLQTQANGPYCAMGILSLTCARACCWTKHLNN